MMLWSLFAVSSIFISDVSGIDTKIYRHTWDTVKDVMGMHGKVGDTTKLPPAESMKFIAENYALVTTGGGCKNGILGGSLEDATLDIAAYMKNINPDLLVGMYWRADMNVEVGRCTNGSKDWNNHPEWRLKDDKGNYSLEHGNYMFDYNNSDFRDFFTNLLLNVLKAKVPTGAPGMDYIYIDGGGGSATKFGPGIGPERSAQLLADKLGFLANLQVEANALGNGQNIIINGVDNLDSAEMFQPTGCAGVMIDHWSILQFLQRGPQVGKDMGKFNVTLMNELFDLVRSDTVANMTQFVKGWVGPIIHQKDRYPATIPQPVTPADFQLVSGERFNSELALFLIVAEDTMFWQYSWFWGFDDWVPDQSDSTVPHGFFPEAKCELGAPKGPLVTKDNVSFTREFEHASVFVNLDNRTDSKVTFNGKC